MIDVSILMSTTSGAALLLGFLLFNHPQKVNKIANRWLSLFSFTLGLAMLEIFLVSQNFQQSHQNYFEIIGISRFLTAPALYLSILSFTTLDLKFKGKYLYHFIPFIIIVLIRFPFFLTGKNIIFPPILEKIIFFVLQNTLPVQAVLYWLLSFKMLQSHIQNLNKFSSTIEKIDLSWLKSFLILLLIIMLLWLNFVYMNVRFLEHLTPILYLCCIFFLAYFSLQQKEIFAFNQNEQKDLAETIKFKEKDGKQKRVNDSKSLILNEKLIYLMQTEKLFLENELTLPKLASKMETSSNEVSYLINELYNQNFNNFVNEHRIDEAKKLLLSEEYSKLNILGIAYQSGFNSKTTFNTTFKKIAGCTPSDFIKKNNLNI